VIAGIGLDVVSLERFGEALARPGFTERVFTSVEVESSARFSSGGRRVEFLAGRFAAKEALAKALGSPGGLAWTDCQVLAGPAGSPVFELSGTVAALSGKLGVRSVHVSITHDAGVAAAVVVLEAATLASNEQGICGS
jgi:holo-[acyl-carrier protein] synthase